MADLARRPLKEAATAHSGPIPQSFPPGFIGTLPEGTQCTCTCCGASLWWLDPRRATIVRCVVCYPPPAGVEWVETAVAR